MQLCCKRIEQCLVYLLLTELVSELSLDELAVEASDIAEIGYAITSVFNAQ